MGLPEKLSVDDFKRTSDQSVTVEDLKKLSDQFSIDLPSLRAILKVEAGGRAWNPSGTIKMLFEGHIFGQLTQYKFNRSHPDISAGSWSEGRKYYLYGDREYSRLLKAVDLDRTAALRSASWGLGQIMGFNAEKCGYSGVEDMIQLFLNSEVEQVRGIFKFLEATPYIHHQSRRLIGESLLDAIRNKDWSSFAYCYNGPRFEEHGYHIKIQKAYEHFLKE